MNLSEISKKIDIQDLKKFFDITKIFEILYRLIFKETDRTIGVNILKRLLGYIEDDKKGILLKQKKLFEA